METESRTSWPLLDRLPPEGQPVDSDDLLSRFLDHVSSRKVELYPAQEEAILELYAGKNLILNTPTGSGKSLVATALHFHSLANGRRSFYTSPIKALVNEKFLALCQEFGPEQVGLITGDASVNPSAPIICCTAEILAIDALRYGDQADVQDVVMDEFHYYSDRERGVAWQVPLLALPQARFLLMSATLGDTSRFEEGLTRLNGRETAVVRSTDRPVPLDFKYEELPLHETIARLIASGRAPIYLVSFTQRECAETAQDLLSTDFCTKDEKKAIAAEIEGVKFSSPYGKDIQRLIKHGVGIHHGGLLPRYRILVERLAQKGLLKIICGTDTLGVGVNVPIRTVLFTKLCKFDGERTALLTVRDFQQIAGRAGRKGFDDRGTVVAQAPEHVVENLANERKAAGDPKKLKKLVKKKPPEKGYVAWSKEIFERLIQSQPEALVSRFQVTHGMLLNVLGREREDGCRAMRRLIDECHESDHNKGRLRRHAFELFRSLVERDIVEIVPPARREPGAPKLKLNVDLQQEFSLNQTLSLYLIDTIKLLEPAHPDYALDVLTLVESILENPELVLRKQVDRLKTEKLHELKMQGMEYDERMEELEKIEHPKPRREFIYDTFNAFARAHPWVGQENIRPKAVAREMYETFQSFAEYVRDYDLQRTEGLLLRYLTEVYKVLVQTVPDYAKNDEVLGMQVYLGAMVRGIDSSLLDEWEKLRHPGWAPAEAPDAAETEGDLQGGDRPPADVTQDRRAFTLLVRNEVFRLVRALSGRHYEAAAEIARGRSPDELERDLEPFYAERSRILTDPRARAPANTRIEADDAGGAWRIEQILLDPEEHNDWSIRLRVDLEASRQASAPVLVLDGVGPV